MPEFSARVATSAGRVFEKSLSGADAISARRELESQDLLVLDLKQRSALAQQLARSLRIGGTVPSRDFLFFNQELRALLKAGLPILPSLDILLERRTHKVFRRALVDIRERVKGGESLSEAFGAQGDLFPKLYASSLASGERSGELVTVIERYIAYTQQMLGIQRKVVSALIYPAILITLLVGLVAVMLFFIIPQFNEFLGEFGTELPLLTRVVVGASAMLTQHWYWVVLGVGGTVIGTLAWGRTENGRFQLDRVKLRLPLVGGIIHDYAQNRFTRTLGTLQSGGIPLVVSLELAAPAVGNAVFERALLKVAERVREGQSLWESLDETALMGDIAIQMVKVGESTGALDEMLDTASDFTDEEVDAKLNRLITLVEPLMLVVMAVVVGVMLLSIYYPLLQVYGQASA